MPDLEDIDFDNMDDSLSENEDLQELDELLGELLDSDNDEGLIDPE